ncbi:MAG: hypothetical protein H6Q90_1866 [Deltaproteobacteria bacterium]|nr:hypothetical protein [Deltaproteobacteria bacterium]
MTLASCYHTLMRWLPLLALTLAAGCPVNNGGGGECQVDRQCRDQVCARDGLCSDASDVRVVKATWTINGAPPDAASCTSDLYIRFESGDPADSIGFSPVPCTIGQYTIDKLPRRFLSVELGVEGGTRDVSTIDATGNATLDLAL